MRRSTLLLCAFLYAGEAAWAGTPGTETSEAREERLATAVELKDLLAFARLENPLLASSREALEELRAGEGASGALPPPQFRYQLWNAPLRHPLSPQMHMFGLSQLFPAWGSRAAQQSSSERASRAGAEELRGAEEELALQITRAFVAYALAARKLELRDALNGLLERELAQARALYQTGRRTERELLRLTLELERAKAELAIEREQLEGTKALINALLGRAARAPLGPPARLERVAEPLDELACGASLAAKPEVAAAAQRAAQDEAMREAMEHRGNRPELMVGFDYMLEPASEHGSGQTMHGFSAMLSATLPWLSQAPQSELKMARARAAKTREERRREELDSAALCESAAARALAAEAALTSFDERQIPLAERLVGAIRGALEAGGSDSAELLSAERELTALRLDRERALAESLTSRAELARARGSLSERSADEE